MVPSLTQCAVCNVPANLKCGGCKNVVYCSKDHQKAHWKKGHKQNCKCVELKVNNLLGRHLVATRDIKQGEIIMREKPLVIGPKVNSFPVCLGCCKTLELQSGDKNYYKCSHCKYPMCGASCEKLKDHQLECNLMAGKKFNAKIDYTGEKKRETHYCTILPLRCLLLEKKNPEGFQKLLDLESHLDKRIDTPIYRILRANFTTFFKTILEMDADINKILTMAAISDTNAFEIQLPHRYIKIRGIYPMAAMIAHNCTPNTRHVFDNNLEMIVIGSVDIKKGETITASYGQ